MRVAVIGSGVAGPVLAMLIKQRLGWDTTVFEAAQAIKEVSRRTRSAQSACPCHSTPSIESVLLREATSNLLIGTITSGLLLYQDRNGDRDCGIGCGCSRRLAPFLGGGRPQSGAQRPASAVLPRPG